jgi:hypothetical protein
MNEGTSSYSKSKFITSRGAKRKDSSFNKEANILRKQVANNYLEDEEEKV